MAYRLMNIVAALILGVAVAACMQPPEEKKPDPTFIQLNITAAPDANPDGQGRPSPVRVYVYALKEGSQFETADPAKLLGGEMGDLAQSMSRKANFVLVAGKTTKKRYELPDGFTAVGVAVGYRQFDTSKWRISAPVKPNDVTLLKANIGPNEITITE